MKFKNTTLERAETDHQGPVVAEAEEAAVEEVASEADSEEVSVEVPEEVAKEAETTRDQSEIAQKAEDNTKVDKIDLREDQDKIMIITMKKTLTDHPEEEVTDKDLEKEDKDPNTEMLQEEEDSEEAEADIAVEIDKKVVMTDHNIEKIDLLTEKRDHTGKIDKKDHTTEIEKIDHTEKVEIEKKDLIEEEVVSVEIEADSEAEETISKVDQ